jgi:UDP-GlcNAc:undecaprenyl-phosphate GlcNAc-1-phosphate transferase
MGGANPFLLFALGVAASMLVIPLVRKVAPQVGLIDLPDPRKVHRTPVPRVGGWGITIGALVPLLLSFQLDHVVQSFVLGVVTLFVFGVWDDVKELGHWTKFAGQLLAVGIVVFHGDLYVTRLPFLDTVTLDPLTGRLFTMFAVVGAINASNHSDGLDGLAGGEALLSLIAMAGLGYVVGDALAVGVALATIGGILGFLRYNSHPARVFMGDSGSQVLGFTLGFLAVYLTQIVHTAISAALPLLLLGLPIADIVVVLYLRMRSGRSWFRATRNHIHHRLLDLGFAHYETVIVIYSVHALLVVSSVLLRYESDWLVTAVYLAIVCGFFAALRFAERRRFDLRSVMKLLRAAFEGLGGRERLRATATVIGLVVPGFALLGATTAETVPADFAIAAAVLAAAISIELVRTRSLSPIARAANYTALIFTAYLFAFHPGEAVALRAAVIGAMAALGLAVAVYIRCAAQQEFGTTPTDYLVVFGLLGLMAFGSIAANSRAVVALVAYAAVLLYAAEIIVGRSERGTRALQVATLGALAIMAVRGAVA